MKPWRAGIGSFLAMVVLGCGGRAEGGDDEGPLAPEPAASRPPTSQPPTTSGTAATPPATSTAPPQQAPRSEPDARLELIEEMLGRYCGECHGEAAIANGRVMGAFDYVEDIDELVERGWIVPLNADESPLLRRIRRGDMPPQGVQPRPSQAEIRAFESFIDGDDLFWSGELLR